MRLRGGEGKWLMKRALAGRLPDEILHRRKMGFVTPISAWFRGPLAAEAAADARIAGRRGSGPGAWLARRLVAGFVKRQAGLEGVRYLGIGGSFLAPDSLRWFWALGVPCREQYGQVETGGIVTTQRGERDLGTAGTPIDPAIEVRLDGEELLVAGGAIAEPMSRSNWTRALMM